MSSLILLLWMTLYVRVHLDYVFLMLQEYPDIILNNLHYFDNILWHFLDASD